MRAVWGRIEPGAACYVHPADLLYFIRDSAGYVQVTRMRGRVKSAWRPSDKTKVVDYTSFEDRNRWGELIDECERLGIRPPVSHSSVFHSMYRGERCPSWVNRHLRPFLYGGWQWCRSGPVSSDLNVYDLRSAYAWAGSIPLPEPKSVWYCNRLVKGGIAVCEFYLPESDCYPYPLRAGRNLYPMTIEDLELYGAKWVRIIRAMRWDRRVDLRPHFDRIRDNFRDWKKILRSYWGRWGSTEPVLCEGWRNGHQQKVWELPPKDCNLLWANYITRRVKARVWGDSRGQAVHVFVDSVITHLRLKEGEDIGNWRLVSNHPKGLVFFHPGAYKDSNGKWVKRSGIAV